MENVNFTLQTDGSGLWSGESRRVQIVGLAMGYRSDENDFGELRVYFDVKTWDTEQHGLIYTDDQFMIELDAELSKLGLAGDDVSYSEQGMQGDDYVSCDVGADFIASWDKSYELA
jgi:hypothetical protein